MIQAFIENPLLLLFVVIAIGYWIGTIRIKGMKLGVAAVLFVGLIFGGISSDFYIPEIIILIGLAIFVYSIGLSSGPSFFTTFRQRGIKDIYFIVFMLTISAALTAGLHFIFNFQAPVTGGIFAGSTTNTPALAGLLDAIGNSADLQKDIIEQQSKKAVVGYSLSYPMGIFGAIFAIPIALKLLKIDFSKEENDLKDKYPVKQEVVTKTIGVSNPENIKIPIRDLKKKYKWKIVFGRLQRGEEVFLTNWDTKFHISDRVIVTGDRSVVEKVIEVLGQEVSHKIPLKHSEYVTKRIFVSNPNIAGERLATLNLNEKFAAIIVRIRRGDIDILASANTTLELGDQVQFIARRKDVSKLSKFFGDSFEALGQINLLSFGLGMALGLLLGMVSIQLPGGITFKLGFAGGPIIVALILGALRRTGPIVWMLPHSANTTLRQIGLILLLAGIGINSGNTFFETLFKSPQGSIILFAGALISFFTAFFTLLIGYKMVRIPFSILVGMVATQPAILDFAIEKTGNKLPLIGYSYILPIALIIKILYVQILYMVL